MKEVISLKDLLDTTFTINDKGEMVGEFTIKRINTIGDILNNYYKENERLKNIINELEKWLEEDESKAMITFETGRCFNYHDIINKIEILKGSDKE